MGVVVGSGSSLIGSAVVCSSSIGSAVVGSSSICSTVVGSSSIDSAVVDSAGSETNPFVTSVRACLHACMCACSTILACMLCTHAIGP